MDIKISDTQFDANLFVQEAAKIGLDLGDLRDYGFNTDMCGGVCPSK